MKILVVVATELEIEYLLKEMDRDPLFEFVEKCSDGALSQSEWGGESTISSIKYRTNIGEVTTLIAGIGMTSTAYNLTKQLCKESYDLVINSGFAGAYSRDLNIGEVFTVGVEQFMDHGSVTTKGFKTLFQLGFSNPDGYPFRSGKLHTSIREVAPYSTILESYRDVVGGSANSLTGTEVAIDANIELFNPDVESMEGAAAQYVSMLERTLFLQLRVVSNYVEPEDIANWDIELAKVNMTRALLNVICKLIIE